MKTRIDGRAITDFLLNPRRRGYRHLLLQITVLLITINMLWYEPLEPIPLWQRFLGWLVYHGMINCLIYFNIYVLAPHLLMKNRYFFYLLSMLGIILLGLGFSVSMQRFLFEAIVQQENPSTVDMLLNMGSGILTMGLIVAGTSTILLFCHWIRYNQRIDELQTMTLQSELKYLRNQINPHFLFNMLNNANVLIRKNPAEASQVLFKLEDLLRYQINDSSREHVSLSSDIRFLNDFLNLEKIRRDKFTFSLAKEGEIKTVTLPPLLFIPFVENAVKHNFDSENPSYVYLFFGVHDEQLVFRCENSKPMTTISGSTTDVVGGIGLTNIQRRLELLYPNRHRLEIYEQERTYSVNLYLDL